MTRLRMRRARGCSTPSSTPAWPAAAARPSPGACAWSDATRVSGSTSCATPWPTSRGSVPRAPSSRASGIEPGRPAELGGGRGAVGRHDGTHHGPAVGSRLAPAAPQPAPSMGSARAARWSGWRARHQARGRSTEPDRVTLGGPDAGVVEAPSRRALTWARRNCTLDLGGHVAASTMRRPVARSHRRPTPRASSWGAVTGIGGAAGERNMADLTSFTWRNGGHRNLRGDAHLEGGAGLLEVGQPGDEGDLPGAGNGQAGIVDDEVAGSGAQRREQQIGPTFSAGSAASASSRWGWSTGRPVPSRYCMCSALMPAAAGGDHQVHVEVAGRQRLVEHPSLVGVATPRAGVTDDEHRRDGEHHQRGRAPRPSSSWPASSPRLRRCPGGGHRGQRPRSPAGSARWSPRLD
jgi:hypothetical protein